MKLSIPHKYVPTKTSTPWINCHIRQEISRRERFYRIFKRSSNQDWLTKYKLLRNKVTSMICSAKKAYFERLADATTNTRKFWSIVRSIQPQNTTFSSSLSDGITSADTDEDKANLLNKYFSSCFNVANDPPTYADLTPPLESMDHFDCIPKEVVLYLSQLKIHSAPGPDGITAWMLTNFADDIAPSNASIFNLSIASGCLPPDWKLSNIIPIPKCSARDNVCFFQPISLLPIISKIFEKHIHRILMEFLSSEGLLSDDQYGFCKSRSTVVPLLLATHDLHKSLESKHQVACIFFDFNKAFDSVPHQALLNNLYCMQVPSLLI